MILFDKKTYTKKRLMIYGIMIVIIICTGFFLFRNNPDYVLNHLKKNPPSTSLYLVENGEELISYQSNVVRPLASTVKILVAAEYAMQVDEGILIKDSIVSLDELNKFYLKGSDGNAHKDWLEEMENNEKNDWPFHQSVFHLLRITNAY